MKKLVYGVGTNDSGYVVSKKVLICGKQKLVWMCPFYKSWKSMLARCYSQNYHARRAYEGCKVCNEWLLFSAFKSWMESQDWKDKQLDKDILVPGNRIYCPEYCVFVDGNINSFLTDCASARGDYSVGVSWEKSAGKFRAECRNPFTKTREYAGRFDTPEAAHEAWRLRKHEHALRYADQQTDPRIAEALRTRFLITGDTSQ